jgi:hypothetical protein
MLLFACQRFMVLADSNEASVEDCEAAAPTWSSIAGINFARRVSCLLRHAEFSPRVSRFG